MRQPKPNPRSPPRRTPRRGLAHFAESSEQNVPVPLSEGNRNPMPTATQPPPWPTTPAEQFARAAHIAGAVRLADVKPARHPLALARPHPARPRHAPRQRPRPRQKPPRPRHRRPRLPRHTLARRAYAGSAEPRCGTIRSPRFRTPRLSALTLLPPPSSSSPPKTTSPTPSARASKPSAPTARNILAISSRPRRKRRATSRRAFALNRDLARLAATCSTPCPIAACSSSTPSAPSSAAPANTPTPTSGHCSPPLATLARERNLAVLVVSHFRKKEGAAIHRTMGSLAFVAAARAAWVVRKDPADADKRLLLPIKNNLAPDVTGLAFTIESDADERPAQHPLVARPRDVTPDNVIADRPAPAAGPTTNGNTPSTGSKNSWPKARAPRAKSNKRPTPTASPTAHSAARSANSAARPIRDTGPFPVALETPGMTAQKYEGEFCAADSRRFDEFQTIDASQTLRQPICATLRNDP